MIKNIFNTKTTNNKIFCISFQRTGTTSTGKFFKDHNFNVQGYSKEISSRFSTLINDGDYESVFQAKEFITNQVFEDNPWWNQEFYKYLYHKFPNSKFILITRDADRWFDSMVSHSNGKTLGNTFKHCKLYNRETEFYNYIGNNPIDYSSIDNLLELNESHRVHYKEIYNNRNKEILNFFKRNKLERLISLTLEDRQKWGKLGSFFNLKVNENYESHSNKSNK